MKRFAALVGVGVAGVLLGFILTWWLATPPGADPTPLSAPPRGDPPVPPPTATAEPAPAPNRKPTTDFARAHRTVGVPPILRTMDDGEEPAALEPAEEGLDEERPVFPSTAEGIKDAVLEAVPELKACYETQLDGAPDLRGRLVVRFTMWADPGDSYARAVDVDIAESDIDHVWLEGCVATVFEELRFERGDADGNQGEVVYPILLDTP